MSRRAQDPVIDGLLHAMVGVDYFSPWALAGVFVVAGFAPRDSRLLWRRLRARYPNLPIVIGFWTATNEKQSLAEPVADASSRVVTTLADAVTAVRAIALHTTPVAKTA